MLTASYAMPTLTRGLQLAARRSEPTIGLFRISLWPAPPRRPEGRSRRLAAPVRPILRNPNPPSAPRPLLTEFRLCAAATLAQPGPGRLLPATVDSEGRAELEAEEQTRTPPRVGPGDSDPVALAASRLRSATATRRVRPSDLVARALRDQ